MPNRDPWRDAGDQRQLARGLGTPVHQPRQDAGAPGIGGQCDRFGKPWCDGLHGQFAASVETMTLVARHASIMIELYSRHRHFDRCRSESAARSTISRVVVRPGKTVGANHPEAIMQHSEVTTTTTMLTRRSAIGTFAAIMAIAGVSPLTASQARSEQNNGGMGMKHYAMSTRTISDAVNTGGLLVVAQWEAKEGQADRIAEILDGFLPEAQKDPGAKLFLISRGKDNPAQFLFYELFQDEAALKAHQDSAYFKTYIAEQALPLLAKRERAQYVLI